MEDDKKILEEDVINNDEVVEEFSNQQKGIPPEIEKMIKTKISQMSNGVFSEEEQEEIYDEIPQNEVLLNKEKGTLDIYLNNEIKRLIKEKILVKNKDAQRYFEENNVEPLHTEKKMEEKLVEQKEKQKEDEIVADENNEDKLEENEPYNEVEKEETEQEQNNEKFPPDVIEACRKFGINHNKIKSYFYVKGNDLLEKVENTLVRKNSGKVLILQVESEKIDGPDRYYGTQEDRMVLYGNEDQAVREVTGKVNKMGKVVEPLRLQGAKIIEYSDDDGLVINERIDDNRRLSVQEANNYREEMVELLQKLSSKIETIENDDILSFEEKKAELENARDDFSSIANKIAIKYDILDSDTRNIVSETVEHTEEEIREENEEEIENEIDDEPDYFEVPGKRTH